MEKGKTGRPEQRIRARKHLKYVIDEMVCCHIRDFISVAQK